MAKLTPSQATKNLINAIKDYLEYVPITKKNQYFQRNLASQYFQRNLASLLIDTWHNSKKEQKK